jgi:glycogen(starch) synthase
MRVVIWTDAFSPDIGGLEVFCLRLLAALRKRGHECLIIANCDSARAPRHELIQGVELRRFAFHEALNRANLRKFRILSDDCESALALFNPDLIHLNICSKGLLAFALLQRYRRRPTVMTLHDRHLYREPNELSREVFSYSNAVVGVSDFIRSDALRCFPELASKITCIHNCLPLPDVPVAPLPREFRFLAVGRLIHEKGFDVAIDAFGHIASEVPSCRLTFVGNGRARLELEARADRLGLRDRIDFLGWRQPDEIPAIINEHSALIMPSRWQEPFGLVALEAAQMGRPICATRSGGLPEIIVHGETGFLFENEDSGGLAQAMRSLLNDPGLAERMGRKGRARALKVFDFTRFCDTYEMLYKKVIGG